MAKSKNANLHRAKSGKNDEFYTQFNDIQNELKHYKEHFKDKVVLCNCDDPKQSNFFKYFAYNFYLLGLKELITTCYKNASGEEFSALNNPGLFDGEACSLSLSLSRCAEKSCYLIYKGVDENGKELRDGDKIDEFIARLKPNLLNHDKNYPAGDFRSLECMELLKKADIVVTNPPFSLFREYVAQLVEYNKKFLIIGNMNALTYKEIFRLVKDNQIWLGISITSGDRKFNVPDSYPLNAATCGIEKVEKNGVMVEQKFVRVKGVRWFTNLQHKKRNEILETIYDYDPQKYPKYDNYDAINVDKTIEIPLDYKGAIGVPITFLDKYNPSQFNIIALGIIGSIDFSCNKKMEILDKNGLPTGKFTFNAKGTLYRKFDPQLDKKPAFKDCETGELYSSIYARILIKNKIPRGKI